jgi:hypothetical protein
MAAVTVVTVAPAWAPIVRMRTVVSLTDRSDPAVKAALKILQDTLVLTTVATDEGDDDEAPENTRDQ